MSTFDVLSRFGTAALLRFVGAVAVFLLLHLARIPLVLTARVLEGVMRRLDAYATRQATQPREPINHYFGHDTAEEGSHVYA